MATRAERRALWFIGAVALLGGGVRVWRAYHPGSPRGDEIGGWDNGARDRSWDRWDGKQHGDGRVDGGYRNGRSKKRSVLIPDSTSTIDLDKATKEEIEALGVLGAGGAQLIVASRDSFGPFGSIDEVKRIPYLTKAEIRKLARRVTFSSVPRPKNAVMSGRVDSVPGRRKRRLTKGDTT
jgi:hypothetical protein